MRVDFATAKLERLFTESHYAIRQLGPEVAWKYINRVEVLMHATNFNEVLENRPLRCHPLEPRSRNYWSIVLTGRWRMIVKPAPDGSALTVEDVSNHYGD